MNDFDPNIPIYLQIINGIKQDIVTGRLAPGDKLPSVRDQAEALSVNPNTVQRAYQELERAGVGELRRGMGTYISGKDGLIRELRTEMARTILENFIGGMQALGFTDREITGALASRLQGGND